MPVEGQISVPHADTMASEYPLDPPEEGEGTRSEPRTAPHDGMGPEDVRRGGEDGTMVEFRTEPADPIPREVAELSHGHIRRLGLVDLPIGVERLVVGAPHLPIMDRQEGPKLRNGRIVEGLLEDHEYSHTRASPFCPVAPVLVETWDWVLAEPWPPHPGGPPADPLVPVVVKAGATPVPQNDNPPIAQ